MAELKQKAPTAQSGKPDDMPGTKLSAGRGGARAGAGRKASSDPSTPMSLTLPHSIVEKLRNKAKAQGITISKFVRSALERLV